MRTYHWLALVSALALAACADDGGTPCPPDVAAFEADVWRPVLENRCNICHNPTGLARRSRFVLSAPGSASGAMGDNLAAAARMARTTEDGQPLLLRRPLGVDHPGGALVVDHTSGEHTLAQITRSGVGARDDVGEFEARVAGDRLATVGIGMPPYHGLCRSTTEPVI